MTLNDSDEPTKSESRASRSRLLSGSTYSLLAYVVYVPVALLVNAFVVHKIGVASFGIWAALTGITGLGSLLDLGISTPLVKYVAEYMALGRQREINVLLSTAMLFYLILGVLFLTGALVETGWVLIHIFHKPSSDTSVRNLYVAILIGFVVTLTFSVLRSLLIGLQRTDINAGRTLGVNLCNALLVVLMLQMGLGVNGLALSWLASSVLTIFVNWVAAKHLFPSLSLNPFLFQLSRLKMILGFSMRVQITTLALVLNDQVDAWLIAYFLGPANLGAYSLAARISVALRAVSFNLMAGILPAASDLTALRQQERLNSLYLRASRYLTIVAYGGCAGVGCLAFPLVHVYLGPGYSRVALTLTIIMVGYAVWLPTQATTDILNGMGHPEIRMRADLAFLVLHIPLSLALIVRFGYFGTVIGTAVALIVTRSYVYIAGSRAVGVDFIAVLRSSYIQPAFGACGAVGAAVLLQVIFGSQSVVHLLLEGSTFTVIYLGYIGRFALEPYDRDLARSLSRQVFRTLVARVHVR